MKASLETVETGKLLQLADFLETVPPEDFTLEYWQERAQKDPTFWLGVFPRDPGCGFAGCAMGWAAHSGLFPEFRLASVASGPNKRRRIMSPTYKGLVGLDAVDALLGLSGWLTEHLFMESSYKRCGGAASPGAVARRARRLAFLVEHFRTVKARRTRYPAPLIRLVG